MGNKHSRDKVVPRDNVSPEDLGPPVSAVVALGAGNYWGTEKFITTEFQRRFPGSIKRAAVGFMSPDPDNSVKYPTYEDVRKGDSGHVEVLNITLANPRMHFEELIRFFFQFHDPTVKDRQGMDCGLRFASYIFTSDDEQIKIAKRVIEDLQVLLDKDMFRRKFAARKVETTIADITQFHYGPNKHQGYLSRNPWGYCNHRVRFDEWPGVF